MREGAKICLLHSGMQRELHGKKQKSMREMKSCEKRQRNVASEIQAQPERRI